MRMRLGILGNAAIVKNKIIPTVNVLEDLFELSAIGTRDNKLHTSEELPHRCSYEDVVCNPAIDVVYIALPNSMHEDWIIKSLKAGKHVICEKPFSFTMESLTEIVRLAESKNLCIRENFQFVEHSQSKIIREILHHNKLGRINMVRVDFGFPPFSDENNIRYKKLLRGGAALDAGTYTLKFLNEFFEDTWEPTSTLFQHASFSDVDIGGAFQLRSSSGMFAQVFFSFDQDYVCRFEILGSKGRLRGDRIFTAPHNYSGPLQLISNNEVYNIEVAPSDHFVSQFVDFHCRILNNDNKKDIASITKQATLLMKCIREV